jgi:hypothetical protein
VPDNSRFIVHAAKERHRQSVDRVLGTLRHFDREGAPVTFVAVANAASVSRTWLYREPTLRAEILRFRTSVPARKPLVPAAQRASLASQHQQVGALNEEMRRLREENARLRLQLERSLGEQRLATARTVPVATLSPLDDMSPTQRSWPRALPPKDSR